MRDRDNVPEDEDPMSEEFRRVRLTDEQWARTHPTWKALRPRRIDGLHLSDETPAAYAERIGVPLEVAAEWLYPLYYEEHCADSYGWIDYASVEFVSERWETARFCSLRTIFPGMIEETAAEEPSQWLLVAGTEDREKWLKAGTWRVPPVILDLDGLGTPPPWSDIKEQFQLIEGHTRLARLLSLARRTSELLAATHEVFVLRARKAVP